MAFSGKAWCLVRESIQCLASEEVAKQRLLLKKCPQVWNFPHAGLARRPSRHRPRAPESIVFALALLLCTMDLEVHLLWTGGVHEGCWSTHSARVSCAIPRHCPAEQHPLPCGLCIPLIKLYSPARKQLVKYEVQACTHSDAVCKGHFVSTWKLRLHRKPAAWCEGSWCASRRTLWHHELFPTPSCAHVQFRFTCTVPRQDAVCYLAGNSSTKVLQGAGEVSSFTSFPPASTGT